ncbi:N-6 DNA methylase [candidate division WOR-3 bacterium]|nr:N-6 DNA methylase [candidate division WOR-3 bacterium]
MTKEEAKQQIQKLVEKYQRIAKEGKIKSYNEAQTRNEFIEPLFGFLGWDMRNLTTDNEVTTEENVSGGRVDLAFRLGNIPVMFLEAKALKVDLDEWKWAEQAIHYSWNKSVTWAVLTDFEAVKIFNAEIPPKNITQNLFIEIKWQDFINRFDQLWLLSKESFEKRLLYKEAEKWGKLTKRKQVNEKLFEDLMAWRTSLTREFKKKNNLTNEELDEGVQRILDRLIFIRTAEDRKIEPNVLHAIYRSEKTGFYRQLIKVFRNFDDGFNSKLFAPHYCEEWKADDKAIANCLEGLYETKDGYRYDFSVISADVLGGMYEQYLSYVQGRKSEEKKKSKRKSHGIYYTPKYIVEFIVKETLGEVLKKTKPKNISKIKVLDPACGSGSFLIVAYDKILEHLTKKSPQTSLFAKYDILKENIFGVDLDAQAVEIAQLNLLLKVLSQKTKLPELQHNLRVGNSLISNGEEKYKPFDFQAEFKEVLKQGGFDIIIGNPPYVKEYTNKSAFDSLHDSPYYQGKMDIWTLFACISIDLLKDGGYFSFIAPSSWLTNAGASIFRDKILSDGQIIKFVDFGDFKVFRDAGIQTMIFIFRKYKPKKNYKIAYAKIKDKDIGENTVHSLLQSGLKIADSGIIKFNANINPKDLKGKYIVFANQTNDEILNKIEAKKNFELTEKEVAQGIVAAPDKYFIVDDLSIFNKKEQEFIKPFYTSTAKYTFAKTNSYIFYLCDKNFQGKNINDYPNIKNHFEPFKKLLKEAKIKYGTPDKPYFYLHREREEHFFQKGPKVAGQTRTAFPSFLYTEEEYYGSRAMNFIKTDRINLKYLIGLLNSRLSYFWLKNKGKQLGDLLQIDKGPLLNVPLLKPNEKTQDKIALLVDMITKLYQDFRNISTNTDKWHSLKNEIEKLEREIDEAIYKLYELTNEEIRIIESTK